jgi:hypothetical protein
MIRVLYNFSKLNDQAESLCFDTERELYYIHHVACDDKGNVTESKSSMSIRAAQLIMTLRQCEALENLALSTSK